MNLKTLIEQMKRKPASGDLEGDEMALGESYSAMEEEGQAPISDDSLEKSFDLMVNEFMNTGASKSEAETMAEKALGINPRKAQDEEENQRVSDIFDRLSQTYKRLQTEGRLPE